MNNYYFTCSDGINTEYTSGNFDPDWHRNLVAALRSGEYVQGSSALKRAYSDGITRHCCLGVATDIDPDTTWTKEPGDREVDTYRGHFPGVEFGNSVALPDLYAKEYGVEQNVLISMNDDKFTFAQIADALEVMIP